MRVSHLLAVVLIGFALLMQSTAYAFAQPALAKPAVSHCEEMQADENPPASKKSSHGCCHDMQLRCLVSMNCISPLFAGANTSSITLPAQAEPIYDTCAGTERSSSRGGPEPPPPQIA